MKGERFALRTTPKALRARAAAVAKYHAAAPYPPAAGEREPVAVMAERALRENA